MTYIIFMENKQKFSTNYYFNLVVPDASIKYCLSSWVKITTPALILHSHFSNYLIFKKINAQTIDKLLHKLRSDICITANFFRWAEHVQFVRIFFFFCCFFVFEKRTLSGESTAIPPFLMWRPTTERICSSGSKFLFQCRHL